MAEIKKGRWTAQIKGVPPHGLGKAGKLVPVAGDSTARNRIRAGKRA